MTTQQKALFSHGWQFQFNEGVLYITSTENPALHIALNAEATQDLFAYLATQMQHREAVPQEQVPDQKLDPSL